MSRIVNVKIKDVAPNPLRILDKYPYVEHKLEALQRSIKDVGLWESVIARESKGGKYEQAFGHHRIEAARRLKLKEIPLIVRPLTDDEMLGFMGRENLEDYAADFRVMLETWEAAERFSLTREKVAKPIEIARRLGWTRPGSQGSDKLSHTASACNAATLLIKGGHLDRNDLREMSVNAAEHIVERAQARMEQLEAMAKSTQRPRKEFEAAKRQVARGAKHVAKNVREGRVAEKDIRSEVDYHAFKYAREDKKTLPLFAAFGETLIKAIKDAFGRDHFADKLEQVSKSLDLLTLEEDFAILRNLDFALSEVPRRTENWRKRLIPTSKKVRNLQLMYGGTD